MSKGAIVFDASALLCLIFREPGAERVNGLLDGGQISAVNHSEIIAKLIDRGDDPDAAVADVAELGVIVVPFDAAQSEAAGRLRATTRSGGLSLGDRACLALTMAVQGRAITTDRAWAKIADQIDIHIEFAR